MPLFKVTGTVSNEDGREPIEATVTARTSGDAIAALATHKSLRDQGYTLHDEYAKASQISER